MQLKGLVKFFTAALILISLYQLSFTFLVRNVEKNARAQARRQVMAANPGANEKSLEDSIDNRYDKITDSLMGEKVVNMLGFKHTYQEAKEQELNLGLDLQGGMNVTLEVSLDELVRSMSNNPKDKALNAAIASADRRKANSQADFVTLFGEEFQKANPSAKIAYLFTKPSQKDITLNSTNDQVLGQIRKEARDAINRTYEILRTRIDKFGVVQPNINLDANKGIVTVELAGVRNPERVREYLQATANLQFFETYTLNEIGEAYVEADKALAAYLSGDKKSNDTTKAAADTTVASAQKDSATVATADTGSLGSLVKSGEQTAATGSDADSNAQLLRKAEKENPLRLIWQADQSIANSGFVGLVDKKNAAKLMDYLNNYDVVRSKFPNNIKFAFASETKEEKRNPKSPLRLYALKTAPGGGARLEGNHIVDASGAYDPITGKPEVKMEMDFTGAQIWKKLTGEIAQRKGFIAIVLDDQVYSSPTVNEEIPNGSTSISGGFEIEEANDLANILKSGKLPAPARIVQEQVVGPTLGQENIAAGVNSLIVAFVVIFILMLVYYNTGGIVANIALILNILFTIGILSSLHATLTMAGIAGLVLTIGMAVDTNVIVFERIKEELSLGKGYQQAVADGYKRSYAPVLDGHITQLLTAIILFVFGLGPVRGFATTQMIGLVLSVFCGLLVSRLVTDMYTKRERHFKYFTVLSKSIFRKAHFKFIEMRKITYGISVVVLLLGVASFFNGFDYGVEFAGGRSYDVQFDKKVSTNEVREKLKPYFGEYPIVKTIGTGNGLNITTTYRIKESGPEVNRKVEEKLYEGLNAQGFLAPGTTFEGFFAKSIKKEQTVLPTISDDLKAGAIWATGLSLAAIFLYILLRFRKWQYSLGTIISLLHDVCVTLAVFSFFRGKVPFALEIDQHFIAAILTVIGFSMNDTVIVFDRVREYFRKSPGEGKRSIINRAINDTLSRTIMTSLTVFLTILILFIFGGEATRGFAFAMLIGVVTGTYSSIFVAAPVLVDMDKKDALQNEVDREARIEELKKLA